MIRVDQLAFSYGRYPVFRNISLALEPGRCYGLLGENGVGKTTLLTLLCGLKKPQSGRILTDGLDPYGRKPSLLGDQFFLGDDPAAPRLTAAAFAREYGAFWPRFSGELFRELMGDFDTDPAARMDRMSSGQRKKTWIALALACQVKYLFLDEPTNGLDIPSKAQFRSTLLRCTSDESTVLISTHQVRDLENIIDPVVILDRQDVLLNASLEEIASRLYFDYGPLARPDALYCEPVPGGFIQVCPNGEGVESKVNLEALFNTVCRHKDLVKGLFDSQNR